MCLVCGDCGHLAGTCLKHLTLLKAQGKIPDVPSVTGTQYHFGQACEVCSLEIAAVDEDSDDVAHSAATLALHDQLMRDNEAYKAKYEELQAATSRDLACNR